MPVQSQLTQIPFTQGQSEGVDAKMLPNGWFESAKNIRFDKDMRVAKRYGIQDHSRFANGLTSQLSAIHWCTSRLSQRIISATSYASSRKAFYAWNESTGWWRTLNRSIEATAPQRVFTAPPTSTDQIAWCECIENNGYVAFAWQEQASGVINVSVLSTVEFSDEDGTLVSSELLVEGLNVEHPRLTKAGNNIVLVFWNNSSSVLQQKVFDTSTPQNGWGSTTSINTGPSVPLDAVFDVCTYSSTQYGLVFRVSATAARIAKITVSTGAFSGAANFGTIELSPLAVQGATGEGFNIAWHEETLGLIKVYSVNDSLADKGSGTTTLDTSTDNEGCPSICRLSSTDIFVGWSGTDSTDLDTFVKTRQVTTSSHALGSVQKTSQVRLASKMFIRTGVPWFWGVTKSNFDRLYVLMAAYGTASSVHKPHATLSRSFAVDFDDTHQHLGLVAETGDDDETCYWGYPFIAKGLLTSSTPYSIAALGKWELNGHLRQQTALHDSMLYMAGGLTRQCDGLLLYENGFLFGAEIYGATASNGAGSLNNNGVYQYVLVREYIDALGRRYPGPPSDPVSITLGGTDDTVDLDIASPPPGWREASWETGGVTVYVKTHVYRTKDAGEIFYRVTDDDGIAGTAGDATLLSFTDLVSDANLISGEPLYTQGTRGGISGQLQNDPAPPCKYLWSSKKRIIIGGLEDPSEVRWSKNLFPGEPAAFTEDTDFRTRVSGTVTGVAALDDRYLIGTKDAIFEVFGDGPDDSGAGEFSAPRKLPSEGGVVEFLLEIPQGLAYVGRGSKLMLLPRGGGAPQWFGQPVRDTIASYPTFRGAVLIPEENTAYFVVTTASGADGAILRYDTRNGQWSVDTPESNEGYLSCAAWPGPTGNELKLAINTASAIRRASNGFVDLTNTYITSELTLGDFFPFGPNGWGHVMRFQVLGEYRAAAAWKFEVSYDSGQSYSGSNTFEITGLTAGDRLEREYFPARQKCGRIKVRITDQQDAGGSTGTEGTALNAITFEHYTEMGLPRLGSAARA